MSDANKTKIAMELYNRASEAIQKGNFDYAIDCLIKCARLVPEQLNFRKLLRGTERKKYGDNKKGAGMTSLFAVNAAKAKLKVAKARKKWADVIAEAEEALRYNPWDATLLFEIGYACQQLGDEGMVKTGIWVLETATEADRKNADVWRLLADLYERDEQFDRAVTSWEMVRKLNPQDHEAAAKSRQLAASATIKQAGYGTDEAAERARAQPKSAATADADVFEEEPAAADTPESRLRREIKSYRERIAADPSNVNLIVQLAAVHRQLREFAEAIAAYEQALAASGGGNIDVKVALLEARIEPLRYNFDVARDRLKQLDSSAADYAEKKEKLHGKARQLEEEIVKRELELYAFKTEIKPDDLNSQFELGYRYVRLGKYDEAIRALQRAKDDLRRKWEALLWTGISFWKKKNLPLAERTLKDAYDSRPTNDEDATKQILYYRGKLALERGESAAALELFNEIAAVDYSYRDVAKILDKLNEG